MIQIEPELSRKVETMLATAGHLVAHFVFSFEPLELPPWFEMMGAAHYSPKVISEPLSVEHA